MQAKVYYLTKRLDMTKCQLETEYAFSPSIPAVDVECAEGTLMKER